MKAENFLYDSVILMTCFSQRNQINLDTFQQEENEEVKWWRNLEQGMKRTEYERQVSECLLRYQVLGITLGHDF